jgi:hypothetical protein
VIFEDVTSNECYLGGEFCYEITFTVEDITRELRNKVIEEINNIIRIKRAVVEENKVKIFDRIRVD